MLAAELATAAELPGRADRRPGSRFAVGLSGVCSLLISASWFFFIHWLAAERRGSAGRRRFRFSFATGSTAAPAELVVGFAATGRACPGWRVGRAARGRTIVPAAELAAALPRRIRSLPAPPIRGIGRAVVRAQQSGRVDLFLQPYAGTRARVDRHSCLISAALADRHFIFVLSAA